MNAFTRLVRRIETQITRQRDLDAPDVDALNNCVVLVLRSTEHAKRALRDAGLRHATRVLEQIAPDLEHPRIRELVIAAHNMAARTLRAHGYTGASMGLHLHVEELRASVGIGDAIEDTEIHTETEAA